MRGLSARSFCKPKFEEHKSLATTYLKLVGATLGRSLEQHLDAMSKLRLFQVIFEHFLAEEEMGAIVSSAMSDSLPTFIMDLSFRHTILEYVPNGLFLCWALLWAFGLSLAHI